MNHFVLSGLCFLSVEILIRSNYIVLINSIIKVSKKAIYIINNKNISDHWKENIIPKYSLQMIKSSIKLLLIFSLILSIFYIADNFFIGLIELTFSLNGIIESLLILFSYFSLRKFIVKKIF